MLPFFTPPTVPALPKTPTPPTTQEKAAYLRSYYEALVDCGFSRKEAMEIIVAETGRVRVYQ